MSPDERGLEALKLACEVYRSVDSGRRAELILELAGEMADFMDGRMKPPPEPASDG